MSAAVVIALAALTLAVRAHTFLSGNDDGDVGTYVLAARAWLHGTLPYVTVWEYKPPGLFAVYAGALAAVPNASQAVAATGAAATFAVAVALWRLLARFGAGSATGLLAAVLWICSTIENDGLLSDAELLVIPFVAASVVVALRPAARSAFLAGLLAGCAIQMKLSALVVAAAPALLVLREGGAPALARFGAATMIPSAAVTAAYALAHRVDLLLDANVGATLRRFAHRAAQVPAALGEQLRLLAPSLQLAPLAALRRDRAVGALALWLLLAAAGVALVGEYDARQLLALHAPLAGLGATGAAWLGDRVRRKPGVLVAVALLAFALHGAYEVVSTARVVAARAVRGDAHAGRSEVDAIVARLDAATLRRDGVWVVEVTPLLYDRLGAVAPTRYPLTSNLLNRALWPMLGFDGDAELNRILDGRPQWIVAKTCGPWCDPAVRTALEARIARGYAPVARLDPRTMLYERRPAR